MRLVCPNCGAQYEVDDQVIPEAGRDVQCSNCGHTWFQRPVAHEAGNEGPAPLVPEDAGRDQPESDAARPEAEVIEAEVVVEAEIEEAEVVTAETEEVPAKAPTASPDQDQYEDTSEDSDAAAAPADEAAAFVAPEPRATPRRELDASLREILRAEAEREAEARARARESEALETQEELGLEAPAATPEPRADDTPAPSDTGQDTKAATAKERVARLRGSDGKDGADGNAPDDTTASGGSESRRDLLPDIEEINSSLAAVETSAVVGDLPGARRRASGFMRGFVLTLLVALVLVMLYIFAPVIGQKIPALAPILDTWMELVDTARGWADRLIGAALTLVE